MELVIDEGIDLSYLDHHNSKYTKEQKIKACATYLLCGNVYQTAMTCGIPREKISDWKTRSSWWPELVDQIRKEKQDELDAIVTTTIDNVIGKLVERIDQGDAYTTKDGGVGYLPVKAKDLAVIMAVLYDKRALIRGEATSIRKESTDSLKTLENRFKEFALQLKEKDVVSAQ